MSISRVFSIVGDSNVRRNMTGLNVASRESMKNAEIIDYAPPASFDAALGSVRAESNICIIAAITELLISGGDQGTVSASIDPILTTLRTKIYAFCASRPTLQACFLVITHRIRFHEWQLLETSYLSMPIRTRSIYLINYLPIAYLTRSAIGDKLFINVYMPSMCNWKFLVDQLFSRANLTLTALREKFAWRSVINFISGQWLVESSQHD